MERFTKNRERVLQIVNESERPLTAYDIARVCPEMSLTTIYRALDYLLRNREVKNFTVGAFTYYVSNSKHEDFFMCVSCGKFLNLDKCYASLYEELLRSKGLKPIEHFILITGLCEECSAKAQ